MRKVWVLLADRDYEGSKEIAAFATKKAAYSALGEIHEAKGRPSVYVSGGDEFRVEEMVLGAFPVMWDVAVDLSGKVTDRMLMVPYYGEETRGKHAGYANTFYGRARTEARARELALLALTENSR